MKIININGEERECVNIYPDPKFAGYMKVEFASKLRKGYTHSEWYSILDFLRFNPKLKDLTTNAPQLADDDTGRVSSAKPNTLTDSVKSWKVDSYLGFPIWISRGKGEGQTRTVIKNTKNTLTIDKDWGVIPNASSQYVLSHNVHDPQIRGNTLMETEKKIKEKNLSNNKV